MRWTRSWAPSVAAAGVVAALLLLGQLVYSQQTAAVSATTAMTTQPAEPKQADVLLEHGAKLNPVSTEGWTPLDFARRWRHEKMARHFEQLGAKPAKTKPDQPAE